MCAVAIKCIAAFLIIWIIIVEEFSQALRILMVYGWQLLPVLSG